MLNAAFIPVIANLKAKFEANKEALVGFFPKKVIDKACHEYAQQQLQKCPLIVCPTEDAIAFYRPLADLKQLKAIIFEQEKLRFSKELPVLAGDNVEQAKTYLHRFRLCRLKNGYQPGVLSANLGSKCVKTKAPSLEVNTTVVSLAKATPSKNPPIKKVRFV
jgi:hypothetical protein